VSTRWPLRDAQAALRPLVAAAAERDRCSTQAAEQRALGWLAQQLRLPRTPRSLEALPDAALRLVVVACTRPLGLAWEPCATCGQPALPSCTLQAQLHALEALGAQLVSVTCISCQPSPPTELPTPRRATRSHRWGAGAPRGQRSP
jgi:hypothetical protein